MVDVTHEVGEEAAGVCDDEVIVVGGGFSSVKEHAMAVCGECDGVSEDGIDSFGGSKEKASLNAATGEEVELARVQATREGHAGTHANESPG